LPGVTHGYLRATCARNPSDSPQAARLPPASGCRWSRCPRAARSATGDPCDFGRDPGPTDIRFRIDFDRKVNYNYYGAYLQDTWRPTPRLVLNLGVRLDHQYGYLPPAGAGREALDLQAPPADFFYDPEFTETIEVVKGTNVSPRLGFVYDVTGDGKTVIKATYGRLYARGLATFVDEINPNDVIEYRYDLNPDYSGTASVLVSIAGWNPTSRRLTWTRSPLASSGTWCAI